MTKLCDSIDTLSMAYLDDELAGEEVRDLELHLRDCADCRAHVDAERDAIAELRRRLAPPPAPDLFRRRVRAALDAEDASIAQAERTQRWTSWVLPGAASLAAVGALALFVVTNVGGRDQPAAPAAAAATVVAESPSIAEQVIKQQVRSPRIVAPSVASSQIDFGGGVSTFQEPDPEPRKVASWDSTLEGRDVYTELYQLGDIVIQASTIDARGLDLNEGTGDRISLSGLDLRYGYAEGIAMVLYQSANGTGYFFTTSQATPRVLATIVAQHDLVTRVAR